VHTRNIVSQYGRRSRLNLIQWEHAKNSRKQLQEAAATGMNGEEEEMEICDLCGGTQCYWIKFRSANRLLFNAS